MQRPGPGWWAWLRDTHAMVAQLAAVPVWLLLALWAGAYMRHTEGWWAWTSLVLGHLRERFGSVWPAALVHAVYNAGFGLTT